MTSSAPLLHLHCNTTTTRSVPLDSHCGGFFKRVSLCTLYLFAMHQCKKTPSKILFSCYSSFIRDSYVYRHHFSGGDAIERVSQEDRSHRNYSGLHILQQHSSNNIIAYVKSIVTVVLQFVGLPGRSRPVAVPLIERQHSSCLTAWLMECLRLVLCRHHRNHLPVVGISLQPEIDVSLLPYPGPLKLPWTDWSCL